jgi:hypothetical protein
MAQSEMNTCAKDDSRGFKPAALDNQRCIRVAFGGCHSQSKCRAGLLARGLRRGATSQDAVELMEWAAYWTRQTSTSFAGHSKIFRRILPY